jgi:hypothetical protein
MLQTALLAALFLCAASAFAANQQLMNLVMPDAKVLAGVNVTSAKVSPFGQFVLARIAASGKPLPPFTAATGFDPRADVTELLFASAADPSAPGGLALALGTFNVSQIVAATASHPGLAVQTYDGDTLIVTTNPNAKVAYAVAFIGSSIAVASDVTDVQAALDRSGIANSILDSALLDEVNTLSTTNDAWVASSVGVPAKKAKALQAVQSFEGGVTFGANVVATGQAVANTPQNAAALANVIQLLANVRNLSGVQVSVTDSTLNLSLSIPEEQIEALINALAAQRQQARTSGQARRPVR